MKILGVIPARGGSKGIPGKNIKLLNGKPLICYTIDAVKESKLLSRTILSTDDENIAGIARENDLEVPFMRPVSLAQDNTPTLAVLQHALNYFDEKNQRFDAVCILQVTSPFRPKSMIDDCIRKFISTNADTLISVREVPADYNPNWVFFEEESKMLSISTGLDEVIPRRQLLPKAYHRDGAIYIIKRDVLLKQNSLFGKSITGYTNSSKYWVNIDTPSDWEEAEKILASSN